MTKLISVRRRQAIQIASLLGLGSMAWGARAQAAIAGWPTKPVNLIVPFPAGGGTDAFARPLAAQFAKATGKTLVIDNRGGAGGTLGASVAAKAAPDGYTLFMGAVHHAIAPSMYPRLDYDLKGTLFPCSCWPMSRRSWWSIQGLCPASSSNRSWSTSGATQLSSTMALQGQGLPTISRESFSSSKQALSSPTFPIAARVPPCKT